MLIISYPKTGRTWLRMMIGRYLCLRYALDETRILDTKLLTAEAGLKTSLFIHDGANLKKMVSWQALNPSKQDYRDRSVVLLTRSIEDTLVSAYFQVTKRLGIFDGTISEMLRDERYGVEKFIRFYCGWFQQQHVPEQFRVVSYEQMQANPADVVRIILELMGESPIDEQFLQAAINFGSFDNMRAIEQSGTLRRGAMNPQDAEDIESHKVRRGVVGGYVDYLSSEDVAYIRQMTAAADCPFITSAST